MRRVYQIMEYGGFVCEKAIPGYQALPEHTFKQLENFILSSHSQDADALEIMGLGARKGAGRVITARNYIGTIMMKDGTVIEILPKICSGYEDGYEEQRHISETKKLVVDMLRTLRFSPFKSLQVSRADAARMNIFEIFIRMFLDEVFRIAKRGLKCDYRTVQANETFFRGKLNCSGHIRENYAHRERCYVEYSEYDRNRPENRLIKATLQYLYKVSALTRNKADIKTLLNVFADIDCSVNCEKDFRQIAPDRTMKDYERALLWCEVFLRGKSFTSFSGPETALALLFPMETLFESFVAARLSRVLEKEFFSLSVQEGRFHLFDEPGKRFLIKPDMVIRRKTDHASFLLDTKWKVLSENKPNYGISQNDMYQMFAYQKKYGAENVTLLYPCTERIPKEKRIEYCASDGAAVHVRFVDLFHMDDSLANLAKDFRRD